MTSRTDIPAGPAGDRIATVVPITSRRTGGAAPAEPTDYLVMVEDAAAILGERFGEAHEWRHHMAAINQVLGWSMTIDTRAMLDQLDEIEAVSDLDPATRAMCKKSRNVAMALKAFKKMIGAAE